MKYIKQHWKLLTFILLVGGYLVFIQAMNRPDLLMLTGAFYMVVTFLLFMGTIVGTPGLILQMFLKKEEAAIPFYKAAIQLKTKNTNILTAYGLIRFRHFETEEALDLLQTALSTTKQYFYHRSIKINIALCYWKLGRIDEAMSIYEEMLYFPDLERITDFSLENLEEGVNLNPNMTPQDYVTMAYLWIELADFEKAEYFTRVAMELIDDYAPAYDNLGQIAYQQGNVEEAYQHFEKALELKPTMSDSLYYMTLINIEKGHLEEAKTWFDQLKKDRINGLSTITLSMYDQLQHELNAKIAEQ